MISRDSGEDPWFQAGIVSFGTRICGTGTPGFYTKDAELMFTCLCEACYMRHSWANVRYSASVEVVVVIVVLTLASLAGPAPEAGPQ